MRCRTWLSLLFVCGCAHEFSVSEEVLSSSDLLRPSVRNLLTGDLESGFRWGHFSDRESEIAGFPLADSDAVVFTAVISSGVRVNVRQYEVIPKNKEIIAQAVDDKIGFNDLVDLDALAVGRSFEHTWSLDAYKNLEDADKTKILQGKLLGVEQHPSVLSLIAGSEQPQIFRVINEPLSVLTLDHNFHFISTAREFHSATGDYIYRNDRM